MSALRVAETGRIALHDLQWQMIVHRLRITPSGESSMEGDSHIFRLPSFIPGVNVDSMCEALRAMKEDVYG